MCIMEVRPGQKSSTIAQAMAHNISTVERDLDMFEMVLQARGQEDILTAIRHEHDSLRKVYAGLLEIFSEEVSREVIHWNSAPAHEHVHGNERPFPDALQTTLVLQARHDADVARKFETRLWTRRTSPGIPGTSTPISELPSRLSHRTGAGSTRSWYPTTRQGSSSVLWPLPSCASRLQ